jgi:RNA polymerase sigma-70 factor, ECF subfamily
MLVYPVKKTGSERKEKMNVHEDLKTSSDWQKLLYNRYHQKVFGICLYFLKDREEAKDASHDVFIKAFRAWGDFEWQCDPMTWIGAIAKHDCFSRMQKFRKHMDRRTQLAMREDTLISPEPEEEMVLHRMRLEKLLPNIHGKLKEILRLSLEQGLNHREIGIRMGVSRVAITRRLTRLKLELQNANSIQETLKPTLQSNRLTVASKPILLESIGSNPVPGRPKLRTHSGSRDLNTRIVPSRKASRTHLHRISEPEVRLKVA